MVTTREVIRGWIEEALRQGATHLIIACDGFNWEDYPVFVKSDEDVQKVYEEISKEDMQRVMEVYNLKMDIESQIAQPRAKNF